MRTCIFLTRLFLTVGGAPVKKKITQDRAHTHRVNRDRPEKFGGPAMTIEKIAVTVCIGGFLAWLALIVFIVGPDAVHDAPRLWHEWQSIFGWS